MTPEEAGEELLMGHPYVTCNHCFGSGSREVLTKEGVIRDTTCSVCFGKGNVARPAYLAAAQLLGAPIPPQPRGKPNAKSRRSR